MTLTRRQEALLARLRTRHGRRKEDCCLVEGVRAAGEVIRRRPELIRLALATERGLAALREPLPVEPVLADEKEFETWAATVTSQGVLLVVETPPEPVPGEPVEDPFILALDRLGDPGNFGTICRTLRAAGLRELWYTRGSVDPYGDKAVRSAMGAQFALHLRSFETLEALAESAANLGFGRAYRTDPHGGESCFREAALFDRSVIIIGGEANGAGELAGALPVTIPMPGVYESINAAQAATVFLFEYVRRIS